MQATPFLFVVGALAALPACSDEATCVEIDVEGCTPTYSPTFDNVFDRTLEGSCGLDGVGCHSAEGAKGGLVLVEADQAYDHLLDGRVVPGDPSCSLVVRRIESTSISFKMPPGAIGLAAGDRCAIEQWIAAGAER